MIKEQKDFHKSRRKEFSQLIGKDSIAVIFGNTHYSKSYDDAYKFKQYKNFFYLTGFIEPNASLIIAPSGVTDSSSDSKKSLEEILFVQKRDSTLETWNGKRLGNDNVKKELGIENGKENTELKKFLTRKILTGLRRLYVNFAEMIKVSGEMKEIVTEFIDRLNIIASGVEIIDASYILGKMRSVKGAYEVNLIKKACEISIKSYIETMKMIKPGLMEYQVQANLEYHYKFNGSIQNAYEPIVAGGENACILHYENNDQVLKSEELLLIDSGAEYDYYNSDITRTFPVSGKFSLEQKTIYEIVLKANKECINKIKPGTRYSSLRDTSDKILADGLNKAGLLKNKKEIKKFSLHGVGHHIGLDTHDAVTSSKTFSEDNDVLKTGNVLTIEPGLYFPAGSKDIPQKFWGIGIRIEDDILVTKEGSENLTSALVKDVKGIEELMKS